MASMMIFRGFFYFRSRMICTWRGRARRGVGGFLAGLAGGALGYVCAAPLFAASRVAQAEAGLLTPDGALYATGALKGRPPTVSSNLGLATLAQMATARGVGGLWRGSEVLVWRAARSCQRRSSRPTTLPRRR